MAASEGEAHHVQFLHDLEREACVRARVERERRQIMPVVVRDLGNAVAYVPGDGLALAQDLARHGVERVIIHADERAAQQVDAVEHEAPRYARLSAAKIALGFANANSAGVPSQREGMANAFGDALQDRQVEIDDVPTRQDIGIEAPDALAKCIECRELIDAAGGLVGHRAIASIHDEHFIDAGRVHRDRQQALCLSVGLDVERQHARLDFRIGRPQGRIVEYPCDAFSGDGLAFDLTAAFDAAFDQIARREAYVRLECIDVGRVETVPHAGDLGRSVHREQGRRRTVKRSLVGQCRRRCAQVPGALRVGRANEKMRPLPVVADEESPPRLQSSIDMDDGNALPMRSRDDAIAGLEDETAELGHRAIIEAHGAIR